MPSSRQESHKHARPCRDTVLLPMMAGRPAVAVVHAVFSFGSVPDFETDEVAS